VAGVLFHVDISHLSFSLSLQEIKYCTFIVLACQEYPTSSSHKFCQASLQQQVMASPTCGRQESLVGPSMAIGRPLYPWEFVSPCLSCSLNFESQHSHRQSTITSRDNLYSCSLSLPPPNPPFHPALSFLIYIQCKFFLVTGSEVLGLAHTSLKS
jgi:hypothetical protein